jgi:hypothetical protein
VATRLCPGKRRSDSHRLDWSGLNKNRFVRDSLSKRATEAVRRKFSCFELSGWGIGEPPTVEGRELADRYTRDCVYQRRRLPSADLPAVPAPGRVEGSRHSGNHQPKPFSRMSFLAISQVLDDSRGLDAWVYRGGFLGVNSAHRFFRSALMRRYANSMFSFSSEFSIGTSRAKRGNRSNL